MSWITHLAIYFIVWWITLFMVLPFGVQRDLAVTAGNDPGAPVQSRIGIKLLVNTLVALVVWFGIFLIDRFDLITISDFSR
jgi:predicted secreted protein